MNKTTLNFQNTQVPISTLHTFCRTQSFNQVLISKNTTVLNRKSPNTKNRITKKTIYEKNNSHLFLELNANLRSYSLLHQRVINDIHETYNCNEVETTPLLHNAKRDDWVTHKTRELMSRNSIIQKSLFNYAKSYNMRLPTKIKIKSLCGNKKTIAKPLVASTSTIQKKPDDATILKPYIFTMIDQRTPQYSIRYKHILQANQVQNQQVCNQRKKAHLSFYRREYVRNSMSKQKKTGNMSIGNINLQTKQIRQVCVSGEKSEFRQYKNRINLGSCTFPVKGIRCHSSQKAVNNLLLLQRL